MKDKKIAFIVGSYPLGVSPMIVNSIRLFASKGFHVDIYINKSSFSACPISFTEDRVSLIVYDDESGILAFLLKGYRFFLRRTGKFLSRLQEISKNYSFSICLFVFHLELFVFSTWLTKNLRYDYFYVLAVECHSLLSLYRYGKKERVVYYNMELLDWGTDNPLYLNKLSLKNLEYRMLRHLSRVVIQSPQRASIFSKLNDFDRDKIYILPVASMGEPVKKKGDFFRQLFNMPKDCKVVIYAGNFMPWARCLEIIESVRDWPKYYCLVMHTWNKAALGTPYYKQMKDQAKGLPVYFSSEYVKYGELAMVLSSADIGLFFYEPMDSNFSEILYSSNKLAEYLKAGLPVICSDFPSLKNFVEENAIGAAVAAVEDLPRALRSLDGKFDLFRDNALACYENKFRFENYFEAFYHRLMDERDHSRLKPKLVS